MEWRYVIDSLLGGLDYAGIVKWLSLWPDLETAVREAEKLRSGQIAT